MGKGIKNKKSRFASELTIQRDFTYIDDVTRIISEAINIKLPSNLEIINVGGSSPRSMSDLVSILKAKGLRIDFDVYPPSTEDIKFTHASIDKLNNLGFTVPTTTLEQGVDKTYEWLTGPDSQIALNAILEFNN